MSPVSIARTSGSTSTRRSSKSTVPRGPRFTGQCGTVCFCPVSPTPANHAPAWGRVSHARIAGLSPFDAMTSGSPSHASTEKFRQFPVRPGTGVARAITHRHGSHTTLDSGATTFAPRDSTPGHSFVVSPRTVGDVHTTQRPSGTVWASGNAGAPQVCQSIREAAGRRTLASLASLGRATRRFVTDGVGAAGRAGGRDVTRPLSRAHRGGCARARAGRRCPWRSPARGRASRPPRGAAGRAPSRRSARRPGRRAR